MAITKTQKELLLKACELSIECPVFTYDHIKRYAEMKSFDLSFNALAFRGFIDRVNNGQNSFKVNFNKARKLNLY